MASLLGALVLVWLFWPHHRATANTNPRRFSNTAPHDVVSVAGPSLLAIDPESLLGKRLPLVKIELRSVSHPLLIVTGSVVARIRDGSEPLEERWQFASSDVATTYADWLQAQADVEFNRRQLEATRELTKAQVGRIEKVIERLETLAPTGTVPRKDLLEAEANLVQARLQGQKDVFSMESSTRTAIRQQAALERTLMQNGIEPIALTRAREGMVLISANVPEDKIGLVKAGQACDARFYGFPTEVYSAHVEELSSVVDPQRHTLRVLFDLNDEAGQLRPGMFAEVGLGTDPREAVIVPATAVVHIGRDDFVFKQEGDALKFAVTAIDLGEAHGADVEIVAGIQPGDTIVAQDAILLKPAAVQSLTR